MLAVKERNINDQKFQLSPRNFSNSNEYLSIFLIKSDYNMQSHSENNQFRTKTTSHIQNQTLPSSYNSNVYAPNYQNSRNYPEENNIDWPEPGNYGVFPRPLIEKQLVRNNNNENPRFQKASNGYIKTLGGIEDTIGRFNKLFRNGE